MIELSIAHAAADEAAADTIELEYRESHPNGEDCGPKCREATATLDTGDLAEAVVAFELAGSGGAGGMGGVVGGASAGEGGST